MDVTLLPEAQTLISVDPRALNPQPYLDPQLPCHLPQMPLLRANVGSIEGLSGGPGTTPTPYSTLNLKPTSPEPRRCSYD